MRVLLTFVAVAFAYAGIQRAEAAIPGDVRAKHKPSPEDAPRMAYLITTSRINYPDLHRAQEELEAMRSGKLSFLEAMRRQSEYNKRNSRNREPQYTGDLGLLSYDQLDEKTSKVLFDVNVPVSTSADKIIGPICSEEYGCSIYVVFSRYRRSFFSQAWLDADQFCFENDLDFGQFLQGLNNEQGRLFAPRIWPDDIPQFQRIKLNTIQNDLKRMKDGDPSTEPPRSRRTPVSQLHLAEAKYTMAERKKFFDAVVTKEIIKIHPEVQSMTIEDVVRSGWVNHDKIKRMGFARHLEFLDSAEEKSRKASVSGSKRSNALKRGGKSGGGKATRYGAGGAEEDITAEYEKNGEEAMYQKAEVYTPVGGTDMKTKEDPAATKKTTTTTTTEEEQCKGGKTDDGLCKIDLDAVQRAVDAQRAAREEAEAAAAAAAAKKAAEEDLDEF